MIRRIVTLSQYRSKLRQAQSKQRQQVQKLNNAIRQYNNGVQQYNTARRRAIDAYNRDIRAFDARIRANQTRLQSALQHLARQTMTVRYITLSKSVSVLHTAYARLDAAGANPFLSDLAEQEVANGVAVLNELLDGPVDSSVSGDELNYTLLANELAHISQDLDSRWHGAIYALNPDNPDAARHFCISTREIITEILDIGAPDVDVLARFPDCQRTDRGTPTRRAKIRHCLGRSGSTNDALENFVKANVDNVLILFKELNSGAHGPAGKYSMQQLISIKTRVEDAIRFMCEIVRPNP